MNQNQKWYKLWLNNLQRCEFPQHNLFIAAVMVLDALLYELKHMTLKTHLHINLLLCKQSRNECIDYNGSYYIDTFEVNVSTMMDL